MAEPKAHVHLELRSDPVYLSGARQLIASVAQRLGFDEMACSQIALAVDEALCNIIRHGYDRATDRPIWVSVWPGRKNGDEPGMLIVIEDEARQIDPSVIKGRELDDVRPGGLGVHIIREVMDEVDYESRENAGMRLTLFKRLVREPADDSKSDQESGAGCKVAQDPTNMTEQGSESHDE